MGFLDFLFGEGPSTEINTLETLTPTQKNALESIIGVLQGKAVKPPSFGGDVTTDLSSLSATSLAGLEDRAAMLANPDFQNQISQNATDTLFKLLDFEEQRAGIDDVFTKTVQDPLVRDFTEKILPAVGRDFGGANFFSSERQVADERAREDLLQTLTQERSRFSFNADQAARDRALQALGIAPQIDTLSRTDSNELLNLFQAGFAESDLGERNIEREFTKFLTEQGMSETAIQQLLASIGTPAFENIVTQNQGRSGFLPALLSVAGGGGLSSGIGAFLDIFKRDDPNPKKTTGPR